VGCLWCDKHKDEQKRKLNLWGLKITRKKGMPRARGPTRPREAYEISKSRDFVLDFWFPKISVLISWFQIDFVISNWFHDFKLISWFQSWFLDFKLISSFFWRFQDFIIDFSRCLWEFQGCDPLQLLLAPYKICNSEFIQLFVPNFFFKYSIYTRLYIQLFLKRV
jgi:hypothetical protein